MKTHPILLTSLLLIIFIKTNTAQIDLQKYLWEYPSYQYVNAPAPMIEKLKQETQAILDNGFLRPLSVRYADQINEPYILYNEPARIMQTLAEAYPFLNPDQQNSVKTYVNNLFSDPEQRFWVQPSYTNRFIPIDYGFPRVLHPSENNYGETDWWGRFRPTIQLIYHAWNYIYRTGDSTLLYTRYNNIKSFYQLKLGYNIDPGNLYGTMSAHIGMARLAQMAGDQAMVTQASNRLNQELFKGLNLDVIDSMAFHGKDGWNAPFPQFCDLGEYCYRKDYFIYRGFIFLNLSAEIGRYMKDNLEPQVTERHQTGLTLFPFWWLLDAPHFSRWAGDETVGIPSEMFGMIIPVEKWVKQSGGDDLAKYFISSPKGIGDCYWIEGLVLAIEAFGEPVWQDVRTESFFVNFAALPPQIVQQPEDLTIAEGETAIFTIQATGADEMEYLWFTPNGTISTGSSPQLTIFNSTIQDAGEYFCVVSNPHGNATSNVVALQVFIEQLIQQLAGWSGISSYLDPLNSNLESLLEPLGDRLVIMYNQNQMYWPAQQVNSIVNWNPYNGYIVKLNDAADLSFPGFTLSNPTISLDSGWQLIPVLSKCPITTSALYTILSGHLIMIKDIAGTGIFWPEVEINTLPSLQPGKAYWLMTNDTVSFTFPDCNP